jgi:thiamine kinase-like enzyme
MTAQNEVDSVFSKLSSVVSTSTAARQAADEIRRLPCWSEHIEPVALPGGLSNLNFVVNTAGKRYVVRYGPGSPESGCSRSREAAALRAAHSVGVAPSVIYSDESVIVMDFIAGRALSPVDVQQRAVRDSIVVALKRLHGHAGERLEGPDFIFWPFHHCRCHIRQALARSDRLDPRWLPVAHRMLSQIPKLERTIGEVRIVFGHGDLVPQNMLLGAAGGITFVDLEYSGFAPDLFDLAGLAMNAELDNDGMRSLLESYYEKQVSAELMRRFCAMVLVAGIRESTWSFKSETDPKVIEFDYRLYSEMCVNRQARLEASFAGLFD